MLSEGLEFRHAAKMVHIPFPSPGLRVGNVPRRKLVAADPLDHCKKHFYVSYQELLGVRQWASRSETPMLTGTSSSDTRSVSPTISWPQRHTKKIFET